MFKIFATIALVVSAAVVTAQPYPNFARPNKKPVSLPTFAQPLPEEVRKPEPVAPTPTPVPAPVKDKLLVAWEEAAKANKPLVIFVATPSRPIAGCVTVEVATLNGRDTPAIHVVSRPASDHVSTKAIWPELANDTAIRVAAGLEVSRPAIPFDQRPQLVQRDDSEDAAGPWLPASEQRRIKSMWPEGVEFPETLKFYKLRKASQRVAAFDVPGAGNNRRFVPPTMGDENANRDFPWIGSGGMDFAEKGTWRNVTGMALPRNTIIKTWTAPMLVSTQYEIAMHWEFPKGTQMFDVLMRRNDDGTEHIFNIRRRVKNDQWDDGTSFMPDVPAGEIETTYSQGSRRSRDVLGVPRITYKVASVRNLIGRPRFKESQIAMNDGGHFFPPGFKGTGMTCNKCHNGGAHESKEYGGPLLRGKDTVFSWYPVPESLVVDGEQLSSDVWNRVHVPGVDRRWPVE